MAEIRFLGSGSAFNFADGNTSAFLKVESSTGLGRGLGVLLDCGSTVPEALQESGLLNGVTHILISHTHADHVGGLELLLQWYFWVRGLHKAPPPTILAPADIISRLRHIEQLGLANIQNDWGMPLVASLESYANIDEISGLKRYLGDGVTINYLPVSHVPTAMHGQFPSYGFDIKAAGRRILFTADTREVVHFDAEEHDLVFHDCQLFKGPNDGAGDVHVSLDALCEELSAEQKAKVWLMHYGKNWRDSVSRVKKEGFAGFVRQGMSFDLDTLQPLYDNVKEI